MRTLVTGRRAIRRGVWALAGALVALTAVAVELRSPGQLPIVEAQAPRIEHHEGTFFWGRWESREEKNDCEKLIGFRHAAGTISFDLDETTRTVRGSLRGQGISGSPLDDERLAQLVGCGPFAVYPGQDRLRHPRVYAFTWAGSMDATFSGTWDPESEAIVLEGTANYMYGVKFAWCDELNRRIECPVKAGGNAGSVPIRLVGRRGSDGAFGGDPFSMMLSRGISFPGSLGIAVGRWETTYAPLAPTPSPSPTPSPTPRATPVPAPTPIGNAPPTPCTECDDQQWAREQAETWAYLTSADGRICTPGAQCVRPNAAQFAAAKEQLRICLEQTMAAERSKPAAQQRTRVQVYVECRQKLPIQVPVG